MENNYNGVDINSINEFASFNYKQMKYMMKQIENSICKIEVKKDKEIKYGSGFLCNILSDIKSKKTNNSSQNYINESNSRFFKDSQNNNSINGSKEILSIKSNENIIINKNKYEKYSFK